MGIALLSVLVLIYLVVGLTVERYTARTRVLLLAASVLLPVWYFLVM